MEQQQVDEHLHYRSPRRKRKGQKTYLFVEGKAENFPTLVKEHIQIQKAQRVPNEMNPKRPTSRNIIIEVLEVKDKGIILKEAREKHLLPARGPPLDYQQKLQVRREW